MEYTLHQVTSKTGLGALIAVGYISQVQIDPSHILV